MTFDPFFDFESRGYLRNRFGEKDLAIVKRLEHSSFVQGVEEAFANLSKVDRLGYRDVLATHKTLFGDIYPWAGQDGVIVDSSRKSTLSPSGNLSANSIVRKTVGTSRFRTKLVLSDERSIFGQTANPLE